MRAVVAEKVSKPEDLTIIELPEPTPGPGQIRIDVKATALNFADTLIIGHKYQVRPDFPFSPGFEVAGDVSAVGPGVTDFKPGDRVIATMDYGAYREQVIVEDYLAHPFPDAMDYVTAASFPVAYGTSYVGLLRRSHIAPGETVLVHGAAGGVGLTAVEIAKAAGAQVIATAGSDEKTAIAKAHGADHVINYTTGPIRDRVKELTDGNGADVIYDPVGGDIFDQSLRCINWGGRILIIGFAAGRIPEIPANMLLVKSCSAIGVFWSSHRRREPESLRQDYKQLFDWWSDGKLKPLVGATYPLDQAGAAMTALLSRKVAGKIVLEV
ncbi:MAG: NADPH:quinone oxidoreductase family protein [Alphaproteobacteria bacterium]|jgi:NADPH:quinone reductase|nr:NADPH:quinone oxidoreductase family protein [Alphaproteobacteria bacterium]